MSQTACIYNFGVDDLQDSWNYRIPGSIFWRIYHVTQGEAKVRIYGRVHRLRAGYLYLIPAFEPHEDMLQGRFVHRYLHFRLVEPHLSEMMEKYNLVFEIPATELHDRIFHRLEEVLPGFSLETSLPQAYEKNSSYIFWSRRYESLDFSIRMELGGYVRILLSSFLAASKIKDETSNPRMLRGRRYIDDNLCRKLTVEEVAENLGMRSESFIRAFRHQYKRTPHTYIMENRLNKAKNMLLLTSMSVKEISVACGFDSPSYFCMLFRRMTTFTPGEFCHLDATAK